jgi:hypothetical protein
MANTINNLTGVGQVASDLGSLGSAIANRFTNTYGLPTNALGLPAATPSLPNPLTNTYGVPTGPTGLPSGKPGPTTPAAAAATSTSSTPSTAPPAAPAAVDYTTIKDSDIPNILNGSYDMTGFPYRPDKQPSGSQAAKAWDSFQAKFPDRAAAVLSRQTQNWNSMAAQPSLQDLIKMQPYNPAAAQLVFSQMVQPLMNTANQQNTAAIQGYQGVMNQLLGNTNIPSGIRDMMKLQTASQVAGLNASQQAANTALAFAPQQAALQAALQQHATALDMTMRFGNQISPLAYALSPGSTGATQTTPYDIALAATAVPKK